MFSSSMTDAHTAGKHSEVLHGAIVEEEGRSRLISNFSPADNLAPDIDGVGSAVLAAECADVLNDAALPDDRANYATRTGGQSAGNPDDLPIVVDSDGCAAAAAVAVGHRVATRVAYGAARVAGRAISSAAS